jgi:hypothetical protein
MESSSWYITNLVDKVEQLSFNDPANLLAGTRDLGDEGYTSAYTLASCFLMRKLKTTCLQF